MLVLNKTEQSTQEKYECHDTSLEKQKLSFHGWFFSVTEKTMKCMTTLLYFLFCNKHRDNPFRCFLNHTREYSPTTESKPIKPTSDQNISVAIIFSAERKPGWNWLLINILALITEVSLCNFSLDTTFPGSRWCHPDLASMWAEKYIGF